MKKRRFVFIALCSFNLKMYTHVTSVFFWSKFHNIRLREKLFVLFCKTNFRMYHVKYAEIRDLLYQLFDHDIRLLNLELLIVLLAVNVLGQGRINTLLCPPTLKFPHIKCSTTYNLNTNAHLKYSTQTVNCF